MKRIKMLAAAAIFCTAGFAGYTAYDKATMTDEEKFMLANLEALTSGEVESGSTVICYSESRSKSGATYYDCGDCANKVYNSKGVGDTGKC
ncbi:MAG: hypothetical protein SNH05_09635 [Rikenellaceae bacterium]